MPLPRALAQIALWIVLIWSSLIGVSFAYWPHEGAQVPLHLDRYHDTHVPDGIFLSNFAETVYELARKCPLPPRKRLFLLGGSGARAFRPQFFSGMGADDVVLISLNASNYTQLRQVASDLHACMDARVSALSTFVIITTAFAYTTTAVRYDAPYTAYEGEKLSNPLWAGPPGAVTQVVPHRWVPLAIDLSRPFLLARYLGTQGWTRVSRRWAPAAADVRRAFDPLNSEFLKNVMPRVLPPPAEPGQPYAPEQSAELTGLIDDLRRMHAQVVIAQQPVQQRLREVSPARYQAAVDSLRAAALAHDVPYIDLSESADDSEFEVPLHATRSAEALWSARLAEALLLLQPREPQVPGARAGS